VLWVFQGTGLDPLLLTIYRSTLLDILKSHLPTVHTYVDDTQRYLLFNPARGIGAISDSTNEAQAVAAIENCIYDVSARMWNNKLTKRQSS